jgi:cell division protein ZipA
LAAELRWILLGFSVLLLIGIWWWGSRRSVQAPGDAQLRETSVGKAPEPKPPSAPESMSTGSPGGGMEHDWSVSPFDPLIIKTDDYDGIPVLEPSMLAHADPVDFDFNAPVAPAGVSVSRPMSAGPIRAEQPFEIADLSPSVESVQVLPRRVVRPGETVEQDAITQPVPVMTAPAPEPPPTVVERAAPATGETDRVAITAPQTPNAAEQQKIVSVRVSARADSRWPGTALLAAFEANGLAFGRYQVFHRRHVDGRSLFCVASLVEPGTFDIANMPAEEFRGITLFAVLPGPVEPLLTIDELFSAANGLAEELSGVLQDAKGMAFSPQRIAAVRDEVARFQASLPRS